MLVNTLFLCFLIGSILQGSSCDDNATNYTGDGDQTGDGNQTDAEPNNIGDGNQTDAEPNNIGDGDQTDYGNQNQEDGSQNQGTKNNVKGSDSQNQGSDSQNQGSDSQNQGSDSQNQGSDSQNQGSDSQNLDTSFVAVENVTQYKETVTLDPKTAHPRLYLSADWKTVSLGNSSQDLDNNTERFDSDPCVLGTIGFNSGKHYFETSGAGGFIVGFVRSSLPRKGVLVLSFDEGIFAIPRAVGDKPDVVGSFLDCDQGQVLFYDASTNEVVFYLRMPNGCNEEMKPFLLVGAGEAIVS